MESGNSEQPEYDAFRSSSSLETLEVAEERDPSSLAPAPPPKRRRSFNIWNKKRLLLVLLIIGTLLGLSVAGLLFVKKLSPKKPPINNVTINTQSLDNGTLNQLTTGSDVKQQLTISPTTIFKNDVAVQGSTQIIKDLTVGGTVTIQSATNIRDSLTVGKSLTVGTNLTVNGLVTAASLNVGSITISSINISGNLAFGGHLMPSGSTPSARISNAAGGGSVTISGNDTAGTITIKTGSGASSGELAIVTFQNAFSSTPKVQLTPVNEPGSSLRYYATKSATFFAVNTGTSATPNNTYIFDYLVTQ